MDGVFLQILEGNGHKRTQRKGLCTGTAKSEPRYDIYSEQIAVYRYIVAALAECPLGDCLQKLLKLFRSVE